MGPDEIFHSSSTSFENLTDEQIRAWSDCAAASAISNPFFEPENQLPASKYLKSATPAFLLTAEREGKLIANVPVRLATLGVGPLKMAVAHTRIRGTGYAVGLSSPHLRADIIDDAARGLVESMCQWRAEGGPGIVVLDTIDDEKNGASQAILRACAAKGLTWTVARTWERPVIRRTAKGLSLDATLGKETRRQVHKRRRRLEASFGAQVHIVDRSDDAAVEEFLRLEASGWKGRQGTAYASRPDTTQWFRSACVGNAALGRLHLLCLQVDERILAIQCCLVSGADAFFFRVAHDDEFSAYGLGVLVQVLGVDYLDSIDVDFVDSCADPDNTFLSTHYPDRRPMSTVVLATGGALDRWAVRSLPLLLKVKSTIDHSHKSRSEASSSTD